MGGKKKAVCAGISIWHSSEKSLGTWGLVWGHSLHTFFDRCKGSWNLLLLWQRGNGVGIAQAENPWQRRRGRQETWTTPKVFSYLSAPEISGTVEKTGLSAFEWFAAFCCKMIITSEQIYAGFIMHNKLHLSETLSSTEDLQRMLRAVRRGFKWCRSLMWAFCLTRRTCEDCTCYSRSTSR